MSLKSPFNEDLYFAQITGRFSVLRRGLTGHFPLKLRGFLKNGGYHNTILPVKSDGTFGNHELPHPTKSARLKLIAKINRQSGSTVRRRRFGTSGR
jgi:hypothetical protein